MAKFIDTYDSLSKKEQRAKYPEELCDLAGVKSEDLFGAVCTEMWRCRSSEYSMMLAMRQPDVLHSTVMHTKQPENYKDRELFFKLSGALPTDKNGTRPINIGVNSSVNVESTQNARLGLVGASAHSGWMDMDKEIIEIDNVLDNQPMKLGPVVVPEQ